MRTMSVELLHAPDTYILGAGQTSFVPAHRSESSTSQLLWAAAQGALADAGLDIGDVDGLGVASFTSAPDHSIDYAVRWNIQPRWLMDSALGGASGIDMLAHARAALAVGDASTILLVAGDHFNEDDFSRLVRHYNSSAARDFPNMQAATPNAYFAMITQLQMHEYELDREDYGRLVIAQRNWAAENPHAAHRSPLDMDTYLSSPMIADPLGRYDCVPVASGAVAVVVSSQPGPIRLAGVQAQDNVDRQNSTGLVTGLVAAVDRLWRDTGHSVADTDVISVYDDYPAMVVAQLIDCGVLERSDVAGSLRRLLDSGLPAVNTSGGQLSAGQIGAGAGMQGVIEVHDALRDRGPTATRGAQRGLVTGYGMVTYRYGSCANAALLERA